MNHCSIKALIEKRMEKLLSDSDPKAKKRKWYIRFYVEKSSLR